MIIVLYLLFYMCYRLKTMVNNKGISIYYCAYKLTIFTLDLSRRKYWFR